MAKGQKKQGQDIIQNQNDNFNLESSIDSPKKPSQLKKRVNECL
jgi:hypothetical protein